MSTPGFTAERSLYRTDRYYRTAGSYNQAERAKLSELTSPFPPPDLQHLVYSALLPMGMSVEPVFTNPCPPIGCATCHAEGLKCCYIVSATTGCYFRECCPENYTCCKTIDATKNEDYHGCFDLQTDQKNCGACYHACNSGELCCKGSCIKPGSSACGCPPTPCPTGEICCDGTCIDLMKDPYNCGGCGTRCPVGHTCCNGRCCLSILRPYSRAVLVIERR
jgi:hypothetical protein